MCYSLNGGLMMERYGKLKKSIPAWYPGESSQEGIRKGERLAIEGWRLKGQLLEGKVTESWKKEGDQFFISNHNPRFAFMGAVCSEKKELFFMIARVAKEKIDHSLINELPRFGSSIKTVIIGEEKYITFLHNLHDAKNNILCTRKESRGVEERLTEEIREFKKTKEKIRKESLIYFLNE